MSKKPDRRRLLAALADEVRQIQVDLSDAGSALPRLNRTHHPAGEPGLFFDAQSSSSASPRFLCIRRRAMACWFEVLLPADRPQWTPAALHALDEVDRVESMLSIYRPDSELSILNRDAALQPFHTSPDLGAFLSLCRSWYEQTGGAFDPASGALIELWGFSRRSPRRPSDAEIQFARLRCGLDRVQFRLEQATADSDFYRPAGPSRPCKLTDFAESQSVPHARPNGATKIAEDAASTVRLANTRLVCLFDVSGVSINPGAIGKGWAIDRAAQVLADSGVDNFLIQAGGSSVLARGVGPDETRSLDAGWIVAVPGATPVRLLNNALATSGSDEQHFDHDGVRYSHIIDPRTGLASTRIGTLTVQSHDAASAEAASTALFLMSADERAGFLSANPLITIVAETPVVTPDKRR